MAKWFEVDQVNPLGVRKVRSEPEFVLAPRSQNINLIDVLQDPFTESSEESISCGKKSGHVGHPLTDATVPPEISTLTLDVSNCPVEKSLALLPLVGSKRRVQFVTSEPADHARPVLE